MVMIRMRKRFFSEKRGWISVLESFMAITLLMVAVLIILEQNNTQEKNLHEEFSSVETGILRSVQLNETCRAEILSVAVPVYWDEILFPSSVKKEIQKKTPLYLNCTAKICAPGQSCSSEEEGSESVYSQSAFISANVTAYSPKVLRIFCWEK